MRFYFMSICGTGMGNAALLMKQLGHEVIGCDQNVYPPMSDRLLDAGIEILPGFDSSRLNEIKPDAVVVGNVNTRGNPEIEWLLTTRAFPMLSMPEILSQYLLKDRKNIVIAGTHGKTTTTALTAKLLQSNNPDSGFLIGGVCDDFENSSSAGKPKQPFVIEGDEYDSAFFDKRSKFIHYCPNLVVINNLEFDHADIFRNIEDIQRTFNHLLKLVPEDGAIITNGDDTQVEQLLNAISWTQIFRVGEGSNCDIQICEVQSDPSGTSFKLTWSGTKWIELHLPLWGMYNVRNASMAIVASALALNSQPKSMPTIDLSPLKNFKGVKRRQEKIFESDQILLFSDFAHHPTAIRGTIESFQVRFPHHQIVACFEARSNTACQNIHENEFTQALAKADRIFFGEVFRSERYDDATRINFQKMAKRIGSKALVCGSNHELPKTLFNSIHQQGKAVVIFFSNGSFDNVPSKCVELFTQNNVRG